MASKGQIALFQAQRCCINEIWVGERAGLDLRWRNGKDIRFLVNLWPR